ncbi:MAG: hypothetical protein FWF69_06955 [Firmicutes bacterium]|nr:hypothetical protein [Bacillota bacterium]
MRKKAICALWITLLLLPFWGCAESFSFPYAGVRMRPQEGWTLLTLDSLEAQRAWIEKTGADIEVLRADYAANQTVFEVFLPGGVQVSLSVHETGETVAWHSIEFMTQPETDALLNRYAHPPYTRVEWSKKAPGYISYQWTLESKGADVPFARLSTIRQGALYTLTATGVGVDMEALCAANDAVLSALDFLGSRAAGKAVGRKEPALPDPIADDGVVTPVTLVDFTGVTDTDETKITIQTLPDTELLLQTQNDILRAYAGESGLQSFTVSTRRETTYTYMLTATAKGRAASKAPISVERRLSAEALEAAYRESALAIDPNGYAQIAASPEAYRDRAVTFRGKIAAFRDVAGFPCALVYTANPGAGEWENPLWVVFTAPFMVRENEMLSVYGDIRGDTIINGETDGTVAVPVVVGRILSK